VLGEAGASTPRKNGKREHQFSKEFILEGEEGVEGEI